MRLDLKTKDEFNAVWNALQQFIDSSNPEQVDADIFRQLEAAIRLRDLFDIEVAKAIAA